MLAGVSGHMVSVGTPTQSTSAQALSPIAAVSSRPDEALGDPQLSPEQDRGAGGRLPITARGADRMAPAAPAAPPSCLWTGAVQPVLSLPRRRLLTSCLEMRLQGSASL